MDTDYFHILAIVNYAAKNIGMHIFLWDTDFIYSDICPEVRLLDHMVFYFNFAELPYCFP